MNARDKLADLLMKHEDCAFSASGVLVCSCGVAVQPNEAQWDLANLAGHQADILTAAGYRRPRTITTAEELDALFAAEANAVLMDEDGAIIQNLAGGWKSPGSDMFMHSDLAFHAYGPTFTVLHEEQP